MSVGRSTGRQTCVRTAEMDSQTHNVPCEYPHNACPILCVVLCGQSISSESYLFTLSRKLPLCGVPIHDRGCDSSASGHGRAYPISLVYLFSILSLPSTHPPPRHNAHNTSYPCPPPPRERSPHGQGTARFPGLDRLGDPRRPGHLRSS